jgi:hypothetical protein
LDLDEPTLPEENDGDSEPLPAKAPKTHQVLRFRNTLADAQRIADRVKQVMVSEGFNTEDDLTNAGNALAHIILNGATNAAS